MALNQLNHIKSKKDRVWPCTSRAHVDSLVEAQVVRRLEIQRLQTGNVDILWELIYRDESPETRYITAETKQDAFLFQHRESSLNHLAANWSIVSIEYEWVWLAFFDGLPKWFQPMIQVAGHVLTAFTLLFETVMSWRNVFENGRQLLSYGQFNRKIMKNQWMKWNEVFSDKPIYLSLTKPRLQPKAQKRTSLGGQRWWNIWLKSRC